MIGHCAGCGAFGHVEVSRIPNGAQRHLCPACNNGWGPPVLPGQARFRLLVNRLQARELTPSDERDLRFALEGILARSRGESRVAKYLLEDLLAHSSMTPARVGNRKGTVRPP